MSCCGSNRRPSRQETQAHASGGQSYWTSGPVEFEYVGTGQLSVTGPLTGAVYYFGSHGARVRVHGPDAPSLLSVPGLRPAR
jgi:hypothetical protein